MQIRKDDSIFSKYRSPSRPLSPASLAAPPDLKRMSFPGSEPWKIDNQTATMGPQPELESRPQEHRQQQSTVFPPAIPPELIDHIVDHLHDDKRSLIQCSRTSRVFSHATSYHLFRVVKVPSIKQCVRLQELIRSSLHPVSSTSTTPHSCSCSSSLSSTSASASPPTSHTTHHQSTKTHTCHVYPSVSDVSATGWDISKFVRKIEFLGLDQQSPIGEYVSEAVKLVGMLPRIREAAFVWWTRRVDGLEQIGQAFAAPSATTGHQYHLANQSSSTYTLSEARTEQTPTGDPLKLHLEFVNFDSVRVFLDFLGSFGGRLRELSLASVGLGRGGDDNGEDYVGGQCFPGLESVFLGCDAVVQPNELGGNGPIMGAMMNMDFLLGMPAFDRETYNVCEVLESTAPNVRELQLFKDDAAEMCMGLYPGGGVLRLPRFRRLKSVTMHIPGPCWSDLIYETAAWFARDETLTEGIADPTYHDDGYASHSPSDIPSLPSPDSATRADRWDDWRKARIRFTYPVRKGDIDWRKLESAVLGEGPDALDGEHGQAGYGNHRGGTDRESQDGNENDHLDGMVGIGQRGAGGSRNRQLTAASLWVEVEVGTGSAPLGELRGELGRLDQLGLLQVSCR